jgi:hypothetical protein
MGVLRLSHQSPSLELSDAASSISAVERAPAGSASTMATNDWTDADIDPSLAMASLWADTFGAADPNAIFNGTDAQGGSDLDAFWGETDTLDHLGTNRDTDPTTPPDWDTLGNAAGPMSGADGCAGQQGTQKAFEDPSAMTSNMADQFTQIPTTQPLPQGSSAPPSAFPHAASTMTIRMADQTTQIPATQPLPQGRLAPPSVFPHAASTMTTRMADQTLQIPTTQPLSQGSLAPPSVFPHAASTMTTPMTDQTTQMPAPQPLPQGSWTPPSAFPHAASTSGTHLPLAASTSGTHPLNSKQASEKREGRKKKQVCAACKLTRVRCEGGLGECLRCREKGLPCEPGYPAQPSGKRSSSTAILKGRTALSSDKYEEPLSTP